MVQVRDTKQKVIIEPASIILVSNVCIIFVSLMRTVFIVLFYFIAYKNIYKGYDKFTPTLNPDDTALPP